LLIQRLPELFSRKIRSVRALHELKQNLKEQLRTIELLETFLKDDSSFLEETASNHMYANSVTEQTDIDH
jgi:hypothetical protein